MEIVRIELGEHEGGGEEHDAKKGEEGKKMRRRIGSG